MYIAIVPIIVIYDKGSQTVSKGFQSVPKLFLRNCKVFPRVIYNYKESQIVPKGSQSVPKVSEAES